MISTLVANPWGKWSREWTSVVAEQAAQTPDTKGDGRTSHEGEDTDAEEWRHGCHYVVRQGDGNAEE